MGIYDMLKKIMQNHKYKIYQIVILSILVILSIYIVLNFNGRMIIKDNVLVKYRQGIIDNKKDLVIYIPEGVTEIMDGAFLECNFISEINMSSRDRKSVV